MLCGLLRESSEIKKFIFTTLVYLTKIGSIVMCKTINIKNSIWNRHVKKPKATLLKSIDYLLFQGFYCVIYFNIGSEKVFKMYICIFPLLKQFSMFFS